MGPTLHERAEHALAVLHRVRAGGERFVGAFLPGAPARRNDAAQAVVTQLVTQETIPSQLSTAERSNAAVPSAASA